MCVGGKNCKYKSWKKAKYIDCLVVCGIFFVFQNGCRLRCVKAKEGEGDEEEATQRRVNCRKLKVNNKIYIARETEREKERDIDCQEALWGPGWTVNGKSQSQISSKHLKVSPSSMEMPETTTTRTTTATTTEQSNNKSEKIAKRKLPWNQFDNSAQSECSNNNLTTTQHSNNNSSNNNNSNKKIKTQTSVIYVKVNWHNYWKSSTTSPKLQKTKRKRKWETDGDRGLAKGAFTVRTTRYPHKTGSWACAAQVKAKQSQSRDDATIGSEAG